MASVTVAGDRLLLLSLWRCGFGAGGGGDGGGGRAECRSERSSAAERRERSAVSKTRTARADSRTGTGVNWVWQQGVAAVIPGPGLTPGGGLGATDLPENHIYNTTSRERTTA